MMLYLFKFVVGSVLLWAVYHLLLRREKLYVFSRFFLLLGLCFSAFMPLISIELPISNLPTQPFLPIYNSHETFSSLGVEPPASKLSAASTSPTFTTYDTEISVVFLVWGLYALITSVLLFRFLQNLWQIRLKIVQNEVVLKNDLRVVLLPYPTTPYSFGSYVFVNKQEYETETIEPEIWQHEQAHVQQRHSWDILLVEFFRAFAWFNPVLWLYRRAIVLNHEFLADAHVLRQHINPPVYQYLLLHRFTRSAHYSLSSSFNYQITKLRFAMMNKNTSRSRAVALQVTAILLIVVVGLAFSDLGWGQNPAPLSPTATSKIPSNPDGATSSEIAEYEAFAKKYVKKKIARNGKEVIYVGEGMIEKDRARMQELFLAMNKDQQVQQEYIMHPPMKPLPKTTPTEKELEAYKNPKVYGVWIDGKKVANTALNKYKASDFSQVFVSRLYKNAQATIGYKYKFQLDLETNTYYEKQKAAALADTKYWFWVNVEKRKSEKK
ncbi:MAG: M56 family metallopeptidase [Spirosomaceae bacterium]|nr:M56 family metallopeptidase [Spirosomataceae bacterium]